MYVNYYISGIIYGSPVDEALYVALKELGYTCYHMAECNLDQQNNSLSLWNRAIDAIFNGIGRKFAGADFDQMLWRYDVTSYLGLVNPWDLGLTLVSGGY